MRERERERERETTTSKRKTKRCFKQTLYILNVNFRYRCGLRFKP